MDAVGTAKIAQNVTIADKFDLRVTAGNRRILDRDIALCPPANDDPISIKCYLIDRLIFFYYNNF